MKPKISLPHATGAKILGILTLSASYAIAGRLSMLLAIPPGYATAIFPSAGIALAALLIWGRSMALGVFLGSFILNLWIGLESGNPDYGLVTLISACIAAGAVLQALVGARLVKRWVTFPTPMTDDREISVFLLIGGPVSCLINATIGVSVLLAGSLITPSQFGYAWWTWWVGDAIGVLIAAPIMLIFFARPRESWRRRRFTVALPLLVSSAIVITVFARTSSWEQQRLQYQFKEHTAPVVDALRSRMEIYLQALHGLERLYASSQDVDRNEFKSYVRPFLSRYPGIHALEWAPMVTHANRHAFEATLHAQGLTEFAIAERGSDSTIVPAKMRETYFPVTYVEPFDPNKSAFGYDLGSNPRRRAALDSARDSGDVVATAPIRLVQDKTDQAGALVIKAVYINGHAVNTADERRTYLRGYVLAVLRLGDLMEAALGVIPKRHFDVILTDIHDAQGPELLYTTAEKPAARHASPYIWSDTIGFAGRIYKLRFIPTSEYIEINRTSHAWIVLAAGLFFTSLLGAYLLSMVARTEKIQHLVERRTTELGTILDNAVEAIITMNDRGRILNVNAAGEKLFGYALDHLAGKNVLLLLTNQYRRQFLQEFINIAEGSDTSFIGRTHEAIGLRRDGIPIPIGFSVTEVALPDRRLFTAIVHDLTERYRVDKMKAEFISTVSHELRTPLTSIRGSMRLLSGGVTGKLPNDSLKLVHIADQNCDRLIRLVNDILTFEKLDLGHMKFEFMPHSVDHLVKSALEINRGFADEHHVGLHLSESPPRDLLVNVDADRFQQVMTNLLSNAIKYSPMGSKVEVQIATSQDRVTISVGDEGPGIPDEFHSRIFQKFAQANSSNTRASGGTGLGLSIVKVIVERLGGRVGYRARSTGGTLFYFTLPIARSKSIDHVACN